MQEQRPDMISTCFNAHDECFDYEPGREPVELYGLHSRDELKEYCEVTRALGVKIEVEAFHYGGVWNAMRMVEKGLMQTPVWVTFFLGWKGGCWTPPTTKAMVYMADHCPEGFIWNTSVMDPEEHWKVLSRRDHARRPCARRHGGQSVHRARRPMRARTRNSSKRSCAFRAIWGGRSRARTRRGGFAGWGRGCSIHD